MTVLHLLVVPLLVVTGPWSPSGPEPSGSALSVPRLSGPAFSGPAFSGPAFSGPALSVPALSGPEPSDRAVWPLQPRPEVVEAFAPPADPWGAGHRGVDLRGHPRQAVRAAKAGTITFAGMLAGRGVVVVDHGQTRTTYEPVHATVQVGERVGAGAVIGSLARFGSHCFPRACLHWGLLRGQTYLDPLTLVGAGPVRLLPLSDGPVSGMPRTASPQSWLPTPGPRTATPWANRVRPGDVLAGRPAAVGLW